MESTNNMIKNKLQILLLVTVILNHIGCGIFEGHSTTISSIAINSKGNLIVSGALNGTIILWDLNKIFKYQWYYWHGGIIHSIQFSPDESSIIVASSHSSENKIIIHDLNGDILKIIKSDFTVTQVFFLSENIIIAGDTDGKLNLFSKNGQSIKKVKAFDTEIRNIILNKQKKLLYTTSFKNNLIKIYDFDLNYSGLIQLQDFVWAITVYDNYKFLIVGLDNGKLQKISLSNNEIQDIDSHNESINYIVSNSVNRNIISSSFSQIKIWDNNFKIIKNISNYKGVDYLSYSPTGEYFIISSEKHDILILNNNYEVINKFGYPDFYKGFVRKK